MRTTTGATTGAAQAREGRFTAEFTRGADAESFYQRLAGDPDGFYVTAIRRNRANGRKVTWQAEPSRLAGEEGGEPRWVTYWEGMALTVGYYGSTFGEPPWGAGKRTAYLNGWACPASM